MDIKKRIELDGLTKERLGELLGAPLNSNRQNKHNRAVRFLANPKEGQLGIVADHFNIDTSTYKNSIRAHKIGEVHQHNSSENVFSLLPKLTKEELEAAEKIVQTLLSMKK